MCNACKRSSHYWCRIIIMSIAKCLGDYLFKCIKGYIPNHIVLLSICRNNDIPFASVQKKNLCIEINTKSYQLKTVINSNVQQNVNENKIVVHINADTCVTHQFHKHFEERNILMLCIRPIYLTRHYIYFLPIFLLIAG